MAACNVKYDKKSYQQLASDLKLLYSQINRPGIEDRIIKTLEFKYKSKDGEDKRLLLTDSENLDETSRDFIDDVNNIVCGLANASLDRLPEKAMKFRNIVLSTFFDMNSVGEVTTQVSETSPPPDIFPPNSRKEKMLPLRHFPSESAAAHPYHRLPKPHRS